MRTVVLSGGPADGDTRPWEHSIGRRIRLPADPALWPSSIGYGTVRRPEHIYVREDTLKLPELGNLPITYRYEGTR